MKAVGIKTLKARLSEFVRMAKSGETILVTERNEVVAELRPAHRQRLGPSDVDDFLDELAARGAATLASATPSGWSGFGVAPELRTLSTEKLLDELREDAPR